MASPSVARDGFILISFVIFAIIVTINADEAKDPLIAQASSFFPKEYAVAAQSRVSSGSRSYRDTSAPSGSTFKFPESNSSTEARSSVNSYAQPQPQTRSLQQNQFFQAVATAASENLDDIDIDEKEAIEILLAASKTGRKIDVGEGTNELNKVTSDPKIKEQLTAGNEAEARNYIRNKLCGLGLMPVRIVFQ